MPLCSGVAMVYPAETFNSQATMHLTANLCWHLPPRSGAAMVYPAETFNPQATLEAVQAERCTSLCERAVGGTGVSLMGECRVYVA